MAKNSGIKLNLPSADDLFSTQEERDEESRESASVTGEWYWAWMKRQNCLISVLFVK